MSKYLMLIGLLAMAIPSYMSADRDSSHHKNRAENPGSKHVIYDTAHRDRKAEKEATRAKHRAERRSKHAARKADMATEIDALQSRISDMEEALLEVTELVVSNDDREHAAH